MKRLNLSDFATETLVRRLESRIRRASDSKKSDFEVRSNRLEIGNRPDNLAATIRSFQMKRVGSLAKEC